MKLNQQVEAGVDPREAACAETDRERKTVDWAHGLYMKAVDEGRASRAKRKNKPRTIADKLKIYRTEAAPTIGKRVISEVTERELITLVLAKGKIARIRANRPAAELKVFFGWAASLRGLEVGLETNPAARLEDLKFPETPRSRRLDLDELQWFLKALAVEERDFRRGMLLWLLTTTRSMRLYLPSKPSSLTASGPYPPHARRTAKRTA